MNELTKEEKQHFADLCDSLMSDPRAHSVICKDYEFPDSSFEYLFLLHRVKNSAATGSKTLVKTVKEIRVELRAAQINEQQLQRDIRARERAMIQNELNIYAEDPPADEYDDIEPAEEPMLAVEAVLAVPAQNHRGNILL